VAVYVSAQQYKYDVVVNVNSETPKVNGKMYININSCIRCKDGVLLTKYPPAQKSDEIISGETYEARGVYLDDPIEKVNEVSFYWESTDLNEKRKLKINYVFLLPYNKKNQLEFDKNQVYVSDTEISSKKTVSLKVVKEANKEIMASIKSMSMYH